MPRRAAGHYHDALGVQQLSAIVDKGTQSDVVGIDVDASAHTVVETFGLLENLFEHEMGVSAFLYLAEIEVYVLYLKLLLLAHDADHLELVARTEHCNVAVFKVDHLVGVLYYRAGIRTKEELSLANAHHEGALLACCYYLAGFVAVDNGYRIGTDDLTQRHLHSCEKVETVLRLHIFYKLNEHLCVGVGTELDALVLQVALYLGIVFDDAVVNYGQRFRLRVVWMRVLRRRFAVSGPAGMGNAHVAGDVFVGAEGFQVRHLAFGLEHVGLSLAAHKCHTGTVVAAVFQPLQSFYQYRVGLTWAYVSYYSTHIASLCLMC